MAARQALDRRCRAELRRYRCFVPRSTTTLCRSTEKVGIAKVVDMLRATGVNGRLELTGELDNSVRDPQYCGRRCRRIAEGDAKVVVPIHRRRSGAQTRSGCARRVGLRDRIGDSGRVGQHALRRRRRQRSEERCRTFRRCNPPFRTSRLEPCRHRYRPPSTARERRGAFRRAQRCRP